MKHFLILIVATLILFVGCSDNKKPLADYFPDQVAGLKLVKLDTGDEALESIDRLHQKSLGLGEAAIASYGTGHGHPELMVWISREERTSDAREQTAIMVEKMLRAENSPFHDPSNHMADGIKVYTFKGMGMVHLIYQISNRVYWISALQQFEKPAFAAFH